MNCWEKTGCNDTVNAGECPHKLSNNCPLECYYGGYCNNKQHERVNAIEMFNHPEIDFKASQKEICYTCRFFLENGPKLVKD